MKLDVARWTCALAGLAALLSNPAAAQRAADPSYPTRPIRFIVPQAAGGKP